MIKKFLIKLIEVYRKKVSPYLSKILNINCKYYPTFSEYTEQAIKKYGVIKGLFKGIKRIIRCNPLSKGGYDPLK